MEASTHFHLVGGPSPYIFVTDFVETEALLGEPQIYIIEPGQAFWGISFDELARAGSGMLILPAPGRGAIVGNDNWPVDPKAGAL